MDASILAFEASELSIAEKCATLLGRFNCESLHFRIYHSQASIYCEEETLHFRVPLFLPPHLPSGGSPEHWQTFLTSCFGQFLGRRGLQVIQRLSGGGCCECAFDSAKSRSFTKSKLGLPKESEEEYKNKRAAGAKVITNHKKKTSELLRASLELQAQASDEEGSPKSYSEISESRRKQPKISVAQELSVQPRLTNIRAIPHFLGRESELEFAKKRFEISKTVTIVGPAGSGKTALAITLGLTLFRDFEIVWKCTADTEPNLSASLKQLAAALNLGDEFYIFLSYMNSHRVLLLLDNLDSGLPDAFRGLAEGDTRLIITTRNPIQTYSINISGLDLKTATRLVIQGTNRETEREDIEWLCKELGFMPLALRNASALLNFSPYERVPQVFQWLKGYSREPSLNSIQLLQKCVQKVTSDAGKSLLILTLGLSPDIIPAQLYSYFFREANQELEQAKKEVLVLSLLEEDEQHNLSVHPLVQQAIRQCHSDELLSGKVQALLSLFTCEQRSELSINLAKSVEIVVNAVKEKYLPEPREVSLCTRFVYFCMKQLGTVQVMSVLCQMCCVWWERRTTITEENVSDLEYLAICCKELQCFRKAEKYMAQVIEFRKRGGNKEKLADSYRNLAVIYRKQGKITESDQLLRKAK